METETNCATQNTATSLAPTTSMQAARVSPVYLKKIRLNDLNPHITCFLCGGYFIDATTIIECLHSFCRSCISHYLETTKTCPICDVQVHKTKPLLNIRSDKALQDIVYKLVPGLYKDEMRRRTEFYVKHKEEAALVTPEERGETFDYKVFYMAEDEISLSLEYGYGPDNQTTKSTNNQSPERAYSDMKSICTEKQDINAKNTQRRYLLCQAGLPIRLLKKFIVNKYDLSPTYKVDIMYLEDILHDDYKLMDVSYIYSWKRNQPLRLFYRIYERPTKKPKTSLQQASETISGQIDSKLVQTSVQAHVLVNEDKSVNVAKVNNKAKMHKKRTKNRHKSKHVNNSRLPTANRIEMKSNEKVRQNSDSSCTLTLSSTVDEPPRKVRKLNSEMNLPIAGEANCQLTQLDVSKTSLHASQPVASSTSLRNYRKKKLATLTSETNMPLLSKHVSSEKIVGSSNNETKVEYPLAATLSDSGPSKQRKFKSFDVRTLIGCQSLPPARESFSSPPPPLTPPSSSPSSSSSSSPPPPALTSRSCHSNKRHEKNSSKSSPKSCNDYSVKLSPNGITIMRDSHHHSQAPRPHGEASSTISNSSVANIKDKNCSETHTDNSNKKPSSVMNVLSEKSPCFTPSSSTSSKMEQKLIHVNASKTRKEVSVQHISATNSQSGGNGVSNNKQKGTSIHCVVNKIASNCCAKRETGGKSCSTSPSFPVPSSVTAGMNISALPNNRSVGLKDKTLMENSQRQLSSGRCQLPATVSSSSLCVPRKDNNASQVQKQNKANSDHAKATVNRDNKQKGVAINRVVNKIISKCCERGEFNKTKDDEFRRKNVLPSVPVSTPVVPTAPVATVTPIAQKDFMEALDLSTTPKPKVSSSKSLLSPKSHHVSNPAIFDKHRGLLRHSAYSTPVHQHPSFTIRPFAQRPIVNSSVPLSSLSKSAKSQQPSSNLNAINNQQLFNQRTHHHHNPKNRPNLAVVTPDPASGR